MPGTCGGWAGHLLGWHLLGWAPSEFRALQKCLAPAAAAPAAAAPAAAAPAAAGTCGGWHLRRLAPAAAASIRIKRSRKRWAPPCTASEIDALESYVGKRLPRSYRAFLSVYGGWEGVVGCGGATETVGLTAAHCVEGEPAEVLSVLFGATEADPETTIQVTEVSIEPTFNSGNRGGDIALLRFAESCPAVIPANRKPLETLVGDPVVMVGFGVTVETANDAGIKRSGVATLFSVTPAEVGGMHDGELAPSNDPHGTCDGDSGGPTFMTIDGAEVVVGVTSRGSNDATATTRPGTLDRDAL